MPRTPVPKTSEFAYHINARSNNREWFFLPINVVWELFLEKLATTVKDYEVNVIAFLLMSNHYHLLLQTPQRNLSEAMNYLQREVSKAIGRTAKRINHVFGAPYRGSLLNEDAYIYNCYKYLYRNPVEAGISDNVETYPYSTIQNLMGRQKLPFQLHDSFAIRQAPIPEPIEQRIHWLNQSFNKKENKAIQLGLRRPVFSFPRNNALKATSQRLNNLI